MARSLTRVPSAEDSRCVWKRDVINGAICNALYFTFLFNYLEKIHSARSISFCKTNWRIFLVLNDHWNFESFQLIRFWIFFVYLTSLFIFIVCCFLWMLETKTGWVRSYRLLDAIWSAAGHLPCVWYYLPWQQCSNFYQTVSAAWHSWQKAWDWNGLFDITLVFIIETQRDTGGGFRWSQKRRYLAKRFDAQRHHRYWWRWPSKRFAKYRFFLWSTKSSSTVSLCLNDKGMPRDH